MIHIIFLQLPDYASTSYRGAFVRTYLVRIYKKNISEPDFPSNINVRPSPYLLSINTVREHYM